jgi:VanZ family protein
LSSALLHIFLKAPWRWVLLAFTALLITVTHWPPDGLPGAPFPFFDKTVHLGAYGFWGLLAGMGGGQRLLWLGLGVALGAGDELTQPYFGRHADWFDWLADAAGVGAGLWLSQYVRRWGR